MMTLSTTTIYHHLESIQYFSHFDFDDFDQRYFADMVDIDQRTIEEIDFRIRLEVNSGGEIQVASFDIDHNRFQMDNNQYSAVERFLHHPKIDHLLMLDYCNRSAEVVRMVSSDNRIH